jgi:hypothetical protein
MKYSITTSLVILAFASAGFAQKTNDAIAKQIKSLKADKQITLTFDGSSTKVMATAGNFDSKEASAAGIQAMNFGMAFFYPGKTLSAPPETINLTFWVLTKKPQFANAHHWTATTDKETLDLGDARYAAKRSENMEYLNFKISRPNLTKMAAANNVKFKLGHSDFTFTPEHLSMLRKIIAISDSH